MFRSLDLLDLSKRSCIDSRSASHGRPALARGTVERRNTPGRASIRLLAAPLLRRAAVCFQLRGGAK